MSAILRVRDDAGNVYEIPALVGPKGDENIFIAVYDETTLADVENAYAAGKALLCMRLDGLYFQSEPSDDAFYFEGVNGNNHYKFALSRTTGAWSIVRQLSFLTQHSVDQEVTNKVSHASVPSTKAVYDYLQNKKLTLTATFADGTTQTYSLYGEAVTE